MTQREQKSLFALKTALASILQNRIQLPWTEQCLRSAIKEYGREHIDEIETDVMYQDAKIQSEAMINKAITVLLGDQSSRRGLTVR